MLDANPDRAALKALVARLREIEGESGYQGVWTLNHIYGIVCSGLTWKQPLEEAEAVLTRSSVRGVDLDGWCEPHGLDPCNCHKS